MTDNRQNLVLAIAFAFSACAATPDGKSNAPTNNAQPVRVAQAKGAKKQAKKRGKKRAPRLARATFEVKHELTVPVPAGAGNVRVWFTMPQDVPEQKVGKLQVDSPYPHTFATDSDGNRYIYIEANNPAGDFAVTASFEIERSEMRSGATPDKTRPLEAADLVGKEKWLSANPYVPVDGRFTKLVAEITGGDKNPVSASRKIYDWVLNNVDYWVKDPKNKKASSVGSAEYCLYTGTGNCTDFHALYASLSRAAGIPTRVVYGSLFKPILDGQDTDASYHCWVLFYAPNLGWVPLDVAVADLYTPNFSLDSDNELLVQKTASIGYKGDDPELVDYYFGNLDERRVVWSEGRDLALDPEPVAGRINHMTKAHVEIDGKPAAFDRKLTYKSKGVRKGLRKGKREHAK